MYVLGFEKNKLDSINHSKVFFRACAMVRPNPRSFADHGEENIESLQRRIRKEMNAGRLDSAKQLASKVAMLISQHRHLYCNS